MRAGPALLWIVLVAGCGRAEATVPADVVTIGGPGSFEGRFATPRAIAWDPKGFIYVVDKTGRIQKFDRGGRFVKGWSTPAIEKGRPTGLAVDPRGDLVVADTHYHRILRYSPDGELRGEFGSEGTGPGQFIYPVGLAVAGDGTIFVSEFGGNDRIQMFTSDGRLRRQWGRYGDGPGEFRRPQGLALAGDRLYVADAANHRVQAFAPDGTFTGSWGGLLYPYSVAVMRDGSVLVAEYGRHHVARFSPDGRPLGAVGSVGSGPGELNTPWAAVPGEDRVFVVDSGNHRVESWPASWFLN